MRIPVTAHREHARPQPHAGPPPGYRDVVEVVAAERGGWFLLRKDQTHYLDVNCGNSYVGFSLLVPLTSAEQAQWHNLGEDYVRRLAEEISHRSGRYRDRAVRGDLAAEADRAIAAWQRSTGRTP